ncbi:Ankyrin repeats (3 copies) [Legionella massiliensis]|uniref:Ankyrin repeats (3 copies) n=2 Tax=Legionella massiliensis TaxID=1034943 RepID=A0A078KWJ8_9GAMM|nr:Ankyrin repeats (3 copies) [Legionella massiliensis]CEE13099.1 Ankyrin repeats (3 copies) [Legionella massiliensis]
MTGNINDLDANDETPLTKAIKERADKESRDKISSFHIAEDEHFRAIRILLTNKDIDVNEENAQGDTPLLIAVQTGQPVEAMWGSDQKYYI